jgi:hypothetical protein
MNQRERQQRWLRLLSTYLLFCYIQKGENIEMRLFNQFGTVVFTTSNKFLLPLKYSVRVEPKV